LLEKNYGKKITKMYLVKFYPTHKDNLYKKYEVQDLSKEIVDLFELRKR